MSEPNENQTDKARQQAQNIDRELQSLQQQIDAVDEEITSERMNQIMQLGDEVADKLNQPEKG